MGWVLLSASQQIGPCPLHAPIRKYLLAVKSVLWFKGWVVQGRTVAGRNRTVNGKKRPL